MAEIIKAPIDPELAEELEVLNNESLSLVNFALEQRSDNDLAAITRGPDSAGPIRHYTYSDVKKQAKYVAYILKNYGNIKKGDKVLLLQYNSRDLVVCYWAVHYLGAVAISAIPPHKYRTHLLRYTNCKAVIAPEHLLPDLENEITSKTNIKLVYLTDHTKNDTHGYKKHTYTTNIIDSVKEEDNLFSEIKHVPYFIGNDRIEENEYIVKYFEPTIPTNINFEEISVEIAKETSKITRTDEALWYFTSGTTGKPKGCVHKQIDLAFAGITYGKRVMKCGRGKITATDTLMSGPYAMGSNLLFPFIAGGTVILDHIIEQNVNKPQKIISSFDKVDLYVSIPTNIFKIVELLDDPTLSKKIGNIEIITSAGTNLPAATFKNFVFKAKQKNLKTVIIDGIGTSELQHIFISNYANDLVSDQSSIGKLVPGYEATLLNSSPVIDKEKTIGIRGELCVRATNQDIEIKYSSERQPIGVDYSKKTQEVNKTIDGHKFYITGDVAMLKNVNGTEYFYLLGRTSDLWDQLANEERAVNDYEALSVSNQIMMAGGLLEDVTTVNQTLYGENKIDQVLVSDVYPIRLEDHSIVYVIAVNDKHWEKFGRDKNHIEIWNKYFTNKIAVPNLQLIFQHKDQIPRTAPPLLKPLKADMKKFVVQNKDRYEYIWELSLIPMKN